MNPEIFTEPERWDPTRFAPDRAEDKKAPHAFVGWGSGKHPCRGMRVSRQILSHERRDDADRTFPFVPQFAKLEMAMIFAFFVTRFDFEAVDKDGKKFEGSPPLESRNFQLQKSDIYLKYKARP